MYTVAMQHIQLCMTSLVCQLRSAQHEALLNQKKKDTWRTPPASAHTCWSGVLCGDTVGVGMIGRVLQWPRFDAHEVGVAAKLIMRSGEGKCVCNSVHARDVGKGLWDGASMTKD